MANSHAPKIADDAADDESFTSLQEFELDEGIPQPDDPFIQKYMSGRQALIDQEKKQRHDRVFKQTMSPMAKQAAKILSSIRRRELQEKWSTAAMGAAADASGIPDLFPGMMFHLSRERATDTEVYKVLSRMPKGALLHCHMDAMVDLEWLIEENFREKGMCLLASKPLSASNGTDGSGRTAPPSFKIRYYSDDMLAKVGGKGMNIWSSSYQPNTPIPIREVQRTFPDNDTTFKKWLLNKSSIDAEDSIRHHEGLNAIWQRFQSAFPVIEQLLFYEPIFRRAMQKMLADLANDGIVYADMRLVFLFEFFRTGSSTAEPGYEAFFEVWNDEIDKFKQSELGKKVGFRGCRMIWTVIRAFDNRMVAHSMKDCIEIKHKFPELICGFDCVGQEDAGRTLADLTPILFWFKKACAQEGVDIPFFFHAGECLGDGDSTDHNLFDAILLGTRRIGHGYSLYKHPLLTDMVKDKKILVESCPISNEVLRLASSVLAHSVPALLSRGVAVSLNNDDPAILGHGINGLTHDFWQTFMASENLGLEGIGTLAENSIRWCAIEDQKQSEWLRSIQEGYTGRGRKGQMMKQWRMEWERWCQWVCLEYPLEVEESDEDGEEGEEEDDEDHE